MDEGKRDPFADFMNALCGHDTVILLLTGIGETVYTTQEVHEMISFRLNNYKRIADAAIDDLSGHCEYCAFRHDCAKHDNNDTDIGFTWWIDCEDWQWRGPQDGE